jgi:hypothetical protein
MAMSSLDRVTPRVPSLSSCSTTQLNAASFAAKCVRTTCFSSYLARLRQVRNATHQCSSGKQHRPCSSRLWYIFTDLWTVRKPQHLGGLFD